MKSDAAKNYAVVGTCRLCGQGRLIVARDDRSGDLYILCEECEREWDSPEATKKISAGTRDVHGRSTLLERDEISGHEWEKFLVR